MQLTILCDNSVTPHPGLIGEHGFACHIRTGNHNYLFDTGSGLGLLNNARILGIDLTALDGVLLSHGHWDHCGALLPLLRLQGGRPLPVYAHPHIFCQRISRDDEEEHDAGTGFSQAEAEAAGARFEFSTAPRELPGGLIFSGEVPRRYSDQQDHGLFCCTAAGCEPDPLTDDQSLYLRGEQGLTILCGCAHAGLRNIIAHALATCGQERLYGLIGGLHLMFIEGEQEGVVTEEIERHNIELLALSHCTGAKATSLLMQRFAATPATVGGSITL